MEENPYKAPVERGSGDRLSSLWSIVESCIWILGFPVLVTPFVFILDSSSTEAGREMREFGESLLLRGTSLWALALAVVYFWPLWRRGGTGGTP